MSDEELELADIAALLRKTNLYTVNPDFKEELRQEFLAAIEKEKRMIPPRARAFLCERRFAVLATINEDGTPHLTTMWYLLEDYDGHDVILMNTKRGRVKEQNIRRDPRVSLLVENEYHYVTISGTVEMIDDQSIAQADIYRLAFRYDGQESAMQQMEETFSREERVTLYLRPNKVYEYCPQ